jgi:anaerobic magnesium-protoporphyrin IX monomethyl ester cyclase
MPPRSHLCYKFRVRVLLFNPRSATWKHRVPMSLLALGALLDDRHDYRIVDGNLEPDPESTLAAAIEEGFDLLGVSVMPGPQLRTAVPITKRLKARFPELVVVWGGYFSSLHKDTVLASGIVDVVVRGQGETTFVELLDAIETRSDFASVAGISFLRDGSVIDTPLRPLVDPNRLPRPPYERVDVERYLGPSFLGRRTTSFHSSIGCPFLCGFCAVAGVYEGRWMGIDAEPLADEILRQRREYRIDAVQFVDNNFFVAEKRTRKFAEMMRGAGVAWWGEARPDTLMKYGEETWSAMAEGGCRMIFYGAETSSQPSLELMNKGGTQTGDTVLALVERSRRYGIVPELSFVFGVPSDDVLGDVERDIAFIRECKRIDPTAEIIFYIYSPVHFESATLFNEACRLGFQFPRTLDDWLRPEWQEFDLRRTAATPWITDEIVRRVRNFEQVLNARYPTVSDLRLTPRRRRVLSALGAWRYRYGVYARPFELRLVANRFFKYRRPEAEGF